MSIDQLIKAMEMSNFIDQLESDIAAGILPTPNDIDLELMEQAKIKALDSIYKNI